MLQVATHRSLSRFLSSISLYVGDRIWFIHGLSCRRPGTFFGFPFRFVPESFLLDFSVLGIRIANRLGICDFCRSIDLFVEAAEFGEVVVAGKHLGERFSSKKIRNCDEEADSGPITQNRGRRHLPSCQFTDFDDARQRNRIGITYLSSPLHSLIVLNSGIDKILLGVPHFCYSHAAFTKIETKSWVIRCLPSKGFRDTDEDASPSPV